MNRRSFLKLIGATALAAVLPVPQAPVKEVIVLNSSGKQRRSPERLGWRVIEPMGIIILNNNAITKIALTEA